MIRHVVVGIPAQDEAMGIVACLDALAAAAERARAAVHVVVADDGSTDGTADLARATLRSHRRVLHGTVVATRAGTAGGARAAAVESGLAQADPAATWVATTDADTLVAPDWLSRQLAWAERGLDAVAGLVDVRWGAELADSAVVRRHHAHVARLGRETGHPHVHGANLGVRATAWRAAGGCAPLADGEDGDLVRRLRATSASVLGVTDVRVTTSGRLVGRAPLGFNGHLRGLAS